jgi:predicted kinase
MRRESTVDKNSQRACKRKCAAKDRLRAALRECVVAGLTLTEITYAFQVSSNGIAGYADDLCEHGKKTFVPVGTSWPVLPKRR